MVSGPIIPFWHACLNGTAALLLVLGFWCIKSGRRLAHRWCMTSALGVSSVFLGSYLSYHMTHPPVRYQGGGWARGVYFLILATHIFGAASLLPLVFVTFKRALKEQWEAHRRLALWTWPIWMYVSVTGVGVYLMLYQ